MGTNEGLGKFKEYFMSTYAPFGKVFVRGEGAYIFDVDGRRYLDFCAGIAVNNVGHCHPDVVRAIREQAGRLMHVSNLYIHERELELAEMLIGMTFPGKLFLCQSGAEANETAIKLARKYARAVRNEDRYKVITAEGAFHGRTLGTVAATWQQKYKADFEPLPEGFVHVPYNDLDAVSAAIDDATCAVMVEPVQGEGGIIIPDSEYLPGLRSLCTQRGVLLILDEVQTGFGRTGSLFAFQGQGIEPDIFTMAKSFGGGLPLGGVMATAEVARAFSPGTHATTFGGNPVSCAAAVSVLKIIQGEDLPARAREMGAELAAGLAGLRKLFPELVADIRGRGLLVGMELKKSGMEAVCLCQDEGLLLTCVQERVLRFTPPLTIGKKEIREALVILKKVFGRIAGGAGK